MLRRTVWLALAAAMMGCQSPFLVFSGGALAQPEVEVTSFAFARKFSLLALEVRPERPYSVLLRVVMRGDDLYIDAAERRRWHTYLKQNPEVRVGLGDTVYPATAVRVEDPALTSQFLAGRTIYRLIPRTSSGSNAVR